MDNGLRPIPGQRYSASIRRITRRMAAHWRFTTAGFFSTRPVVMTRLRISAALGVPLTFLRQPARLSLPVTLQRRMAPTASRRLRARPPGFRIGEGRGEGPR